MSSISMIDQVRIGSPDGEASRTDGTLEMIVGGPLDLDRRDKYADPITIKFVIIQGPPHRPGADADEEEEAHEPRQDRRIRGCTEASPAAVRWTASVRLKPDEFLEPRGARGIAMAVMEKGSEYAFETLTWCDFMMLPKFEPGASSELVPDTTGSGGARRWVTSSSSEPATPFG